jgi:MFS family permease
MGGLIAAVVPAVLAQTHGAAGREIAFAEATAVTYAFAVLGPMLMGLAVTLALGWRGVVLLGATFGMLLLGAFRRTALPDPTGEFRVGRAACPWPTGPVGR